MWKKLTIAATGDLNETLVHLHHGAQLVAMMGNAFLPHRDDDSQSSMRWNRSLSRLQSQYRGEVQVSLDIPDFALVISTKGESERIRMANRSKADLVETVQSHLSAAGLDAARYRPSDRFSLPPHPLSGGGKFVVRKEQFLEEWARYWDNTHELLEGIANQMGVLPADIAVWPHHFDMAILIVLARDDQQSPSKTLGFGLAIADGMVPEPYFYIRAWSQEGLPDVKSAPARKTGAYQPAGYDGLVLPVNRIVGAGDQQAHAEAFFTQETESLLERLAVDALPNKTPNPLFSTS